MKIKIIFNSIPKPKPDIVFMIEESSKSQYPRIDPIMGSNSKRATTDLVFKVFIHDNFTIS